MTREVAALGGREFPPSMSDLKPGGLYSLSTLFLALGRGALCAPSDLNSVMGELCLFELYRKYSTCFRFFNERVENTRTSIQKAPPLIIIRRQTIMAVKEKMRIRLKGYDHNLVDKAAEMIV